jgi:hypothetical protein
MATEHSIALAHDADFTSNCVLTWSFRAGNTYVCSHRISTLYHAKSRRREILALLVAEKRYLYQQDRKDAFLQLGADIFDYPHNVYAFDIRQNALHPSWSGLYPDTFHDRALAHGRRAANGDICFVMNAATFRHSMQFEEAENCFCFVRKSIAEFQQRRAALIAARTATAA